MAFVRDNDLWVVGDEHTPELRLTYAADRKNVTYANIYSFLSAFVNDMGGAHVRVRMCVCACACVCACECSQAVFVA